MKKSWEFYKRLNHARPTLLFATGTLAMAACGKTSTTSSGAPQFMFVQSAEDLKADPAEDVVLDLGPGDTIYATNDGFHQYYTRIPNAK